MAPTKANTNSKKLTVFIFTLGFCLLIVGITWLFFERSLLSTSDATVVASVDYAEGSATIQRKSSMLEIKAGPGIRIFSADKIKTGPAASVILSTQNGSQIKVDENTTATIEKKADKELVTVLMGHTQTIKQGENLEVQNTQEKWRTARIQTQITRKEVTAPAPAKPAPAPTPTAAATDEQNLKSVLEGQRNFFNRCFAKHVIQNPEANGEIVLGFLLLPQGKTANTRVLSSSFKDTVLEKCLTTVIDRSPFKRFAGDPISVTYPIKFE